MNDYKEQLRAFIDRFLEEKKEGEAVFNITTSNPHYKVFKEAIANGETVEEQMKFDSETWNMSVSKAGFLLKVKITHTVVDTKDDEEEVVKVLEGMYTQDRARGHVEYLFSNSSTYTLLESIVNKTSNPKVLKPNKGSIKDLEIIKLSQGLISVLVNKENSNAEKASLLSRVIGPDRSFKDFIKDTATKYPNIDRQTLLLGLGNLMCMEGAESFSNNKGLYDLIVQHNLLPEAQYQFAKKVLNIINTKPLFPEWVTLLKEKGVSSALKENFPILQFYKVEEISEDALKMIYENVE